MQRHCVVAYGTTVILIGGILLVGGMLYGYQYGIREPNRCQMSYIPYHTLHTVSLPRHRDHMGKEDTKHSTTMADHNTTSTDNSAHHHHRYRLHFFHENTDRRQVNVETDIPVLFIPGHDGNPNQGMRTGCFIGSTYHCCPFV